MEFVSISCIIKGLNKEIKCEWRYKANNTCVITCSVNFIHFALWSVERDAGARWLIDSVILPLMKYSVSMRCWYGTDVKSNGSTCRSKLQNRLYGQSIGLSLHSEYWRVITRAHPNIRFNADMGEDKQRSYWMMKRGTRQTYAPPKIPL